MNKLLRDIIDYERDGKELKTFITIKYFNLYPLEEQIQVVEYNPYNLRYINNPIDYLQEIAIKKDPKAIKYITCPSKELQLLAIRNDGTNIVYIENPDREVQLEAVKENPFAIEFINNPDKEVQLAAVTGDVKAAKYINQLHIDIITYLTGRLVDVINNCVDIGGLLHIKYDMVFSETEQLSAVIVDPFNIRYIGEPTYSVQMLAVTSNPKAIKYIDNPHVDVQLKAVHNNASNVININNISSATIDYVKQLELNKPELVPVIPELDDNEVPAGEPVIPETDFEETPEGTPVIPELDVNEGGPVSDPDPESPEIEK